MKIFNKKKHIIKDIPHWLNVNRYRANLDQKNFLDKKINYKFNFEFTIPFYYLIVFSILAIIFLFL